MTHKPARTIRVVGLALAALCLTACPLPVSRTEATSAPVVGRLVSADGRPVANAEVAVSTEWGERGCEKPAHRTRTDANGAFELPGTQQFKKVRWIIPNLDIAPLSFHLCTAISGTLSPAYVGHGSFAPTADPDTVACVVWEWDGHSRVTCNGRGERSVVTGGRWTDSTSEGGEGFYRLFQTSEPARVKGFDKPQHRPNAYVQWVQLQAANAPDRPPVSYRVRTTLSFPFDRDKVFVHQLQIWRREGRWLASLHGAKDSFMGDARAELVFELGPPGQIKLVAGP